VAHPFRQGVVYATHGMIPAARLRRFGHKETAMICTHRMQDSFCVVSIEGNIALDGVNEAKSYLKPHLESPAVKGLIMNFEKVNFIDSSGIGLIVSIFKTMQQKEGKFALTNLSKKNEEIFSITRLNKILDIFESEQEALGAMKA
jgi:stage II sporulation protein AA (anti-sigma F factor antagonist)